MLLLKAWDIYGKNAAVKHQRLPSTEDPSFNWLRLHKPCNWKFNWQCWDPNTTCSWHDLLPKWTDILPMHVAGDLCPRHHEWSSSSCNQTQFAVTKCSALRCMLWWGPPCRPSINLGFDVHLPSSCCTMQPWTEIMSLMVNTFAFCMSWCCGYLSIWYNHTSHAPEISGWQTESHPLKYWIILKISATSTLCHRIHNALWNCMLLVCYPQMRHASSSFRFWSTQAMSSKREPDHFSWKQKPQQKKWSIIIQTFIIWNLVVSIPISSRM